MDPCEPSHNSCNEIKYLIHLINSNRVSCEKQKNEIIVNSLENMGFYVHKKASHIYQWWYVLDHSNIVHELRKNDKKRKKYFKK